jgi:hypothetical protein
MKIQTINTSLEPGLPSGDYTTSGFHGSAVVRSEDEDAQEILEISSATTLKMQRTQRNALRDGDCFVWITREDTVDAALYPEAKTRLIFNILPPEQVNISLKTVNRSSKGIRLQSTHTWLDERDNPRKAVITQRISAGKRSSR